MVGNKKLPAHKSASAKQGPPAKQKLTNAPAMFVIDPLLLGDLSPDAFIHYMECLQIVSFSLLREDFTGLPQQVDRLENGMTLCDYILACHVRSRPDFVLNKYVVKRYVAPATSAAWLSAIREDSLALAKAMIELHIADLEDDVAQNLVPDKVMTGSWADEVSDSEMCQDDGPRTKRGRLAKTREPSPVLRPTTPTCAPSDTTSFASAVKSGRSLAPSGKSDAKAHSAPSRAAIKSYAYRRKLRVTAHLGSIAVGEARRLASEHCSKHAAILGLPSAVGTGLADAFVRGDYSTVLEGLRPALLHVTCKYTATPEPHQHLLERATEWKSLPVKTVYTMLADGEQKWANFISSQTSS